MKKKQKASVIGYVASDWKKDWKTFRWMAGIYNQSVDWRVLELPYVTDRLVNALCQLSNVKVKVTIEEIK